MPTAPTAQGNFDAGRQEEAQGNKDRALDYYNQAIRIDPSFGSAYTARGNVYLDKKDYDKAVADFTRAIQLLPYNYEPLMGRGQAYANKGYDNSQPGLYDTAIQDFNQALKLKPNSADTYARRGRAYYYKEDYDAALADYLQSNKIDPNFADVYYALGLCYEAKGELDQALGEYDQFIKLQPSHSWAYYQRANAYYSKGTFDKAIEDYSEAIRLDPSYTDAYYGRGLSNVGAGKPELALTITIRLFSSSRILNLPIVLAESHIMTPQTMPMLCRISTKPFNLPLMITELTMTEARPTGGMAIRTKLSLILINPYS